MFFEKVVHEKLAWARIFYGETCALLSTVDIWQKRLSACIRSCMAKHLKCLQMIPCLSVAQFYFEIGFEQSE